MSNMPINIYETPNTILKDVIYLKVLAHSITNELLMPQQAKLREIMDHILKQINYYLRVKSATINIYSRSHSFHVVRQVAAKS